MAASMPGVTFEACIYPLHPYMREVQEQVMVRFAPTCSEIHYCRSNYCRVIAPQHEGGFRFRLAAALVSDVAGRKVAMMSGLQPRIETATSQASGARDATSQDSATLTATVASQKWLESRASTAVLAHCVLQVPVTTAVCGFFMADILQQCGTAARRMRFCQKTFGAARCTTVVRSVSVYGFGSYRTALRGKEACGTHLSRTLLAGHPAAKESSPSMPTAARLARATQRIEFIMPFSLHAIQDVSVCARAVLANMTESIKRVFVRWQVDDERARAPDGASRNREQTSARFCPGGNPNEPG
ncbi:unnamed protein product [Polarella glacialis]|uniref:Uncharacterized protein n=1 Tax=Polarella glacialis TaxID=89957 RepID=A0A813J581_POLGL|nr:unnamed protein product [Polarella glacialis]